MDFALIAVLMFGGGLYIVSLLLESFYGFSVVSRNVDFWIDAFRYPGAFFMGVAVVLLVINRLADVWLALGL